MAQSGFRPLSIALQHRVCSSLAWRPSFVHGRLPLCAGGGCISINVIISNTRAYASRRTYTQEEDDLILERRRQGCDYETIANELNRSIPSVMARYQRSIAPRDPAVSGIRKHKPEQQTMFDAIVQGMEAGKYLTVIAEELAMPYYSLYNIVSKFRPPRKRQPFPDQQVYQALLMQKEGASYLDIARALGKDHATIRNGLRRAREKQREHLPSTSDQARAEQTLLAPNDPDASRREALREARKRHRRWTEASSDQLIELYKKGYKVNDIALQMGRSYGAVRERIYVATVNGQLLPRNPRLDDDCVDEIVRLRDIHGHSMAAIARRLGRDESTIRKALIRRHGAKPKPAADGTVEASPAGK